MKNILILIIVLTILNPAFAEENQPAKMEDFIKLANERRFKDFVLINENTDRKLLLQQKVTESEGKFQIHE